MINGKYCRLRHAVTKNEVKLVEDYVDGVHVILHFYADAKEGLFREINLQACKDEENFGLMWKYTIKGYQSLEWEVVDD